MDSYRDLASDGEPDFAGHAADEPALPASGGEKRLQVRAFNYWASLLHGRDFPSIEDLEPASIAEFAGNSVLLDFTAGPANPTTAYVGAAIRRECDLDPEAESMAEVPAGSLLARLTETYSQILDSRAPVGFEAEFANQRGAGHRYRGILMPFSSDGDTIDFIYGVFSWAETLRVAAPAAAAVPVAADAVLVPALPPLEVEDEVMVLEQLADEPPPPAPVGHLGWQDGPMADPEVLQAAGEATLGDWLTAARATAEDARAADGRSRQALYRALGLAYDFACAAVAAPEEYGALLVDSGIVPQARAPMTAVAKLVFGADSDKARLTEYAAALSFAARQQVEPGGFLRFIEGQPGGLKALVEAERRLRKPAGETGGWRDAAVARLRSAEVRPLDSLAGNGEFALVRVRRDSLGQVAPVAAVSDPALLDKALRRASV